jgi:hypothetical protein
VISNFLNKTPVVKITEKSLRGYGSDFSPKQITDFKFEYFTDQISSNMSENSDLSSTFGEAH